MSTHPKLENGPELCHHTAKQRHGMVTPSMQRIASYADALSKVVLAVKLWCRKERPKP